MRLKHYILYEIMLSLQFIPAGEPIIDLLTVPSAVLTHIKTRLEQVHHLKKKLLNWTTISEL